MTGALVAVGRGRLSMPQLKEILEARDSLAYPQGLAAPASGLFLTRVDYRDAGEQVETRRKMEWEPNNYFSAEKIKQKKNKLQNVTGSILRMVFKLIIPKLFLHKMPTFKCLIFFPLSESYCCVVTFIPFYVLDCFCFWVFWRLKFFASSDLQLSPPSPEEPCISEKTSGEETH